MNHLAHLFLADRTSESLASNLAADSLKGDVSGYPMRLQEGIRLHRSVDAFTDGHPDVWASKRLVHPVAGRYAGPVTDLFFDHILATEWSDFTDEPLEDFIDSVYRLLQKDPEGVPMPFGSFLPRMIADDWLSRYKTMEGTAGALARMNGRLRTPLVIPAVVALLSERSEEIRVRFRRFFPELQEHARKIKQSLDPSV